MISMLKPVMTIILRRIKVEMFACVKSKM